ncbi:MAG: hypothetical protein JNG86_04070 [Verrucomicrobiaceae bacterium]|nr:hypothetical protein [Verrucomicrobiaceae bacterium]
MNSKPLTLAITFALLCAAPSLRGQGSLTPPPGPPAPTMKTLQNLWDKLTTMGTQLDGHSGQLDLLQEEHQDLTTLINTLKTQTTTLQGQATALQAENAAIKAQNEALTNLMLSMGGAAGTLPWTPTNVDAGGTFSQLSFASGPNGKMALGFLKNGALRVAIFNGTSWSISIVPASGTVTCLSVQYNATTGWPAVAYGTAASGVKYADYSGSSWTIFNVDNPGGEIRGCSLAMTSSGWPAIAYAVYPVTLKFALAGDLGWNVTTVRTFSQSATQVDLAYGPAGQPCILYVNDTISYLSFNGSTWSTESIDSFPSSIASLGFSPAGIPCVACTGNGTLFFFERLSSGWQRTILDGYQTLADYSAEGCSLTWTPGGRPAIAYHTYVLQSGVQVQKKLKYAVYNGVGWTTIIASSEEGVGKYPGLCFDPQGQPVIACTASNESALRVTRRTPFIQP